MASRRKMPPRFKSGRDGIDWAFVGYTTAVMLFFTLFVLGAIALSHHPAAHNQKSIPQECVKQHWNCR